MTPKTKVSNEGSEDLPEITTEEIRPPVQQMKNRKTSRDDSISM